MPEPEDQNLKNLIRSKGPKGPKLDHDPNDSIVAPSTIGLSTRQPRPVKAVDPQSVVLIRHRLCVGAHHRKRDTMPWNA